MWCLTEALITGLFLELELTPKPGLVDRWNSGSHDDLDYVLMRRSIGLLTRFFADCAEALRAGCAVESLRNLGIQAENRMLIRLGTNTHRGAIFLGSITLAAVHASNSTEEQAVSGAVTTVAERLFSQHLPLQTKGAYVRSRYHVGGIVQETLNGLPSVFEIGVIALREAQQMEFSQRDSLLLAMARLMQTVEDTTALRRCGPAGLTQIKRDGARLETVLMNHVNPVFFLAGANRRYCEQRLTMGGVADLLAISAAWLVFTKSEPAVDSA